MVRIGGEPLARKQIGGENEARKNKTVTGELSGERPGESGRRMESEETWREWEKNGE